MTTQPDFARYRANWQAETDAAAIYAALARMEKQPALAALYTRMGDSEHKHAIFWADKLRAAGGDVPTCGPTWRARSLIWLARRLGPQIILPTLAAQERSATAMYTAQPEVADTDLPGQEQSHARLLDALAGTDRGAGVEGNTVARLEGRHRAVGGNALRAAVLGANDGLVSNMSLVMGVAGAALDPHAILITGLAGLLAGATSMAMGEWLSVQSSRELYERQIAIEQSELAEAPEEEAQELALIYQSKGLSAAEAKILVDKLMLDHGKALDTLAREELGIDPDELGGSAWEAAFASFALFAVGAIFPVLPFMLTTGHAAVWFSLILSTVVLFGIGAAITLLTGRGVLYTGARQLVFGLGAAGLTYGIGRLIGVTLAG